MIFKSSEFGFIPQDWGILSTSDYCEVITDYVANGSFKNLAENVNYNQGEKYAVLIRLTDYHNGFNGEFIYINKKAYDFLEKSKLHGGEIIIANVGANAGTTFIVPNLKVRMSLGPNAIMVKTKGCDNFYYYWFSSRIGKGTLQSIITGSAQPKFNKTEFRKLNIPVPPIKHQKAIAVILSSLDDKIALNNKINQILEEISQTLYKRWFTEFEFPNDNGQPYKSSGGEMVKSELGMIPVEWSVITLGEIIKFIKGKKPSKICDISNEDMFPYLTIDAMNNGIKQYATLENMVTTKLLDTTMIMDGASSGKVYFGYEGIVSSTAAKIHTDDNYSELVYLLLKNYENEISRYNTGSAIPHADKNFINNIRFCLPNVKILIKLSEHFVDFRLKIIQNKMENDVLQKIRDSVLPKLMSGEIRVLGEE